MSGQAFKRTEAGMGAPAGVTSPYPQGELVVPEVDFKAGEKVNEGELPDCNHGVTNMRCDSGACDLSVCGIDTVTGERCQCKRQQERAARGLR